MAVSDGIRGPITSSHEVVLTCSRVRGHLPLACCFLKRLQREVSLLSRTARLRELRIRPELSETARGMRVFSLACAAPPLPGPVPSSVPLAVPSTPWLWRNQRWLARATVLRGLVAPLTRIRCHLFACSLSVLERYRSLRCPVPLVSRTLFLGTAELLASIPVDTGVCEYSVLANTRCRVLALWLRAPGAR